MHFISRMLILAMTLTAFSASAFTPPTEDIWIGKHKALILLLEWDNRPAQITREEVEKTFFGMAPGDFSMRQFMLENSGGKFDLEGTVLPWTHTKQNWNRLWCMTQEKLSDLSELPMPLGDMF